MLKLYRFHCGSIITKKHLLVEGPASKESYEVPVPFYLIDHPEGKVLFDTGQPHSAISGPKSGDYIPVMSEDDYILNQLERHELKANNITHIVLSHLHSDHTGGIEAFNGTECYLNEAELEYGSRKKILEKYPLKWNLVKGDYDIYGDGKIKIIHTPGHTPGHQSLLVKLDEEGEILLAADSVYTDEILDRNVLPGVYDNKEDTIKTLNKIKEMRNIGIKIISGHDPIHTTAEYSPTRFKINKGSKYEI